MRAAIFGDLGLLDPRRADIESDLIFVAAPGAREQSRRIVPVEIVEIVAERRRDILRRVIGFLDREPALQLAWRDIAVAVTRRRGRGRHRRVVGAEYGRAGGVSDRTRRGGIGEVEGGDDPALRIDRGQSGGRIGFIALRHRRLGHAALAPALIIIAAQHRDQADRLHPPKAALLDEVALEHRLGPQRPGLVAAEHPEIEPARPALVPVGRDRDQCIELEMLVDLAAAEPAGAGLLEPAADAALALPDATPRHLDRAVCREEVGDVVPELLVDIIAVSVLQVADEILIAHPRQPPLDRGRGGRCDGPRIGRGRCDRHAGLVGGIVIGNGLEIRLQIAPAIGIGAGIHGDMVQAGDLPDAVLQFIVILLDAAFPAGIGRPAQHRDFVPAPLGAAAVGGDGDDRGQSELGVELAGGEPVAAAAELRLEPARDRGPAFHAVGAVIQHRVAREQVRHLVPQAELRIIGVGDLQPLDRAHPLQPIETDCDPRQIAGLRQSRRGAGQSQRRRDGGPRPHSAARMTGLRKVPIGSISIATWSPGAIRGAWPSVPMMITSPGTSVM